MSATFQRKESVRVIQDAKKAGIHVTARGFSPHHLILIDEDIPERFLVFGKMNPPLRGQSRS